jgi:hypothetical protein
LPSVPVGLFDSLRHELEDISSGLESKVKREADRCKLLEEKIAEKKAEASSTKTLDEFRHKKEALLKEYNRAKFETMETKESRTAELSDMESKMLELKHRQAKISKLFSDLRNAEKVDICFMVDCTGSMSSYINEAKTVIHRIVDKLGKRFKDLRLRCAFVGYRDHSDGAQRVQAFGFTEDKDVFKAFVTTVAATGGADECEDIFGGLEELNKLTWVSRGEYLNELI